MKRKTAVICISIFMTLFMDLLTANPIRPLAQEHVVVATSKDTPWMACYTPSILRLETGRLLAAFEYGGEHRLEGGPWALGAVTPFCSCSSIPMTAGRHGKNAQGRRFPMDASFRLAGLSTISATPRP